MTKKIMLACISLLLLACSQESAVSRRLRELNRMQTAAVKISDSLPGLKGNTYIEKHAAYYNLMNQRTNTASGYLAEFSAAALDKEDLRKLIEIAQIAKDEQQIVNLMQNLFDRFPETREDIDLIKTFFTNAWILDPALAEKYLNLNKFSPSDQLYCFFMLSLGFAEAGNKEQARNYLDKAERLYSIILLDPDETKNIPLASIAGLKSVIQYQLGNSEEAYQILENARTQFPDKQTQDELDQYLKRLQVMDNPSLSLEAEHWIGTGAQRDLRDYKGKVILLYCYSWDCETCNLSLPLLFRLQEQVPGGDFMILGVSSYNGSYENVSHLPHDREYQYLRDHYYQAYRITWPLVMSDTRIKNFGISSIPSYLVIDKQGRVRSGYFINNYTWFKKKILSLLAENA